MKNTTIKLSALSLAILLIGYGVGKISSQSANSELHTAKDRQILELQSQLESRLAQIDQLKQATAASAELVHDHSHATDSDQHAGHNHNDEVVTDEELVADADTPEQIAAEAGDTEAALSDVNQLIADAKQQSLSGLGISEKTRDRLTKLVAKDPFSQEQLLQAYMNDPFGEAGESLRLILGEFRDENIEAAALSMTAPDNDAKLRLAGLELLQQMGIENSKTLDVALNIVTEESDSQLINSALDTLQFQTVSSAQSNEVRDTILPRLSDNDPEIRRRSVIAYSDWVTNPDAVAPVIGALDDPSVDVRVGAAYAMSKVAAKSTAMRDALVRKLDDEEEDWQVREQAWHALEQHEMDEATIQIYAEFKDQLDAQGESVQ